MQANGRQKALCSHGYFLLFLSLCLSVSVSPCLSLCFSLSVSVSLCLCLSHSVSISLSVSVSVSLCLCLPLSLCLSLCLWVFVSFCLCLSVSFLLKMCSPDPVERDTHHGGCCVLMKAESRTAPTGKELKQVELNIQIRRLLLDASQAELCGHTAYLGCTAWHPRYSHGTKVVLWTLSNLLHVMSWESQSINSLFSEVLLCARLSSKLQYKGNKTDKVLVPPQLVCL